MKFATGDKTKEEFRKHRRTLDMAEKNASVQSKRIANESCSE
jgi:hypothetical protein